MKSDPRPQQIIESVLSSLSEAQTLFDFNFEIKSTSDINEFCDHIEQIVEQLEAERELYEERAALQAIDDGKTTTQRAIAALQRAERFRGEHDVARAWLREQASHAGIFRKVAV